MKYTDVVNELLKKSNKEKAKILSNFFKTGKGQYGEGDICIGVIVPDQRKIAKDFLSLSLSEIQKLLRSKIHEHRLTALFILIFQFDKNKNDNLKQKKIVDLYLKNTKYINNWDLVDLSAPKILGAYLNDKPRDILYKFSMSKGLWERRISIISTYTFIKHNDFEDSLKISEKLLSDGQDLIHKAVGWMLREVGKKNKKILEKFLNKNIKKMPRTALRYSIERFPEIERKKYLSK